MSTVTDPIADLLARVRNGTRAQKLEVLVPYSKIKAEIARILKEEGYISDYSIDTGGAHPRGNHLQGAAARRRCAPRRSTPALSATKTRARRPLGHRGSLPAARRVRSRSVPEPQHPGLGAGVGLDLQRAVVLPPDS